MGITIKKFIHTVPIDGKRVEISIECDRDFWEARADGWGLSGGSWKTLEEFISEVERCYTYQYNFFKHGYKYAKENLTP